MSRYGEIIPVTDKDKPIPGAWLDPHYTDHRFTEIRTEGLTIFMAKGAVAVRGSFGDTYVDGAHYEYSDRIHQGFDYDLVRRATQEAESAVGNKNTASFFEAMLRGVFQDDTLNLLHIIAGVNRGNGYPYRVYGTVLGSNPVR